MGRIGGTYIEITKGSFGGYTSRIKRLFERVYKESAKGSFEEGYISGIK
jgi:hypothetical protein